MMAVLTLVGLSLQGQRRSLASVVVLNVLVNGLLIGGLLALPIGTAVQAGMIYSTSAAVVMLFSWLLWSKGRPYGGPAKTQEITMPLLWHGAIPLWIVAGVQIIQQRSAQLVAGVFVSPEDVALLALAQRTALLTSLVLTAINIVIAPGLASLHDEGDAVGLRRESRKAVRQSLLGTTPMLLVMVAFPETVMGIFGEEYRDGATLLQILALGQFVNAGSGSTGYLLTMSGHERDVRNSLLVFFPVTLAAAILCTAEFGVVGGACSTAFAIMGRNLFCVYFVRKRLGFNPLVFWKP
jgi:O-antigen/teichoic acid export membrane protein